jgi:hypothetical protein
MKLRSMRPLLLLLALALSGCAASTGEGAGSRPGDPNILTQDMLSRYPDALSAVQTLRSNWLRLRTPGAFNSTGQIRVYRDNVEIGPPEVLRGMSTIEIESIRWYDGRQAFERWGLGHENGVIFVTGRTR